jgi:toluene monooxygenase system protein E
LKRPENASVLRRWVQRWTPKADEAATGLAHLLAELPEVGREAETTMTAAKAARERVLSEAGVLAAMG